MKRAIVNVTVQISSLALWMGCVTPADRFGEVEKEMRAALPVGSSIARVNEVLDSMKVEHSQLPSDSTIVLALVRAIGHDSLVRVDAQFRLRFDSSWRLTEITAKRVLTGP